MTEESKPNYKVGEVVEYVEFLGGKSYPAVVIKRECNWTYTIKAIGNGDALMRTEAGLQKATGLLNSEISNLRHDLEQTKMMLEAVYAHNQNQQ